MSTNVARVLVLGCSTRPGALGPHIRRWLTETLQQRAAELGAELVPVELAELNLPFLDEEEHPSSGVYRHEHTRRWSALAAGADGFIVVTPEYNYGMPASLKNALDYLGREWAWKPMGFVSYGNTSAGTRSVQHAKQVVTTLRLVPAGATVAIRIAEALRDGRLRPDPARDEAAAGLLEEVVRLSRALAPMRERADAVPGPLPGSYLRRLSPDDAPEVTVLQRCCWVDEALANDTTALAPLHETVDDVRAWLADWDTTGLWRDGRLLGMIRTRPDDGGLQLGRLAVVPDLRGRGLGRRLLRGAQAAAPDGARITLCTGAKSLRNIALYESEGFETAGRIGGDAVMLAKTRIAEAS